MNANFKRLLSGTVCASMLLSSIGMAYATEVTTGEVWNNRLICEEYEGIYEDFPMSIDKTLGKDMSLSIQMSYLKNIASGDTVSVTIVDISNDKTVMEYDLSSDNVYINWENVENNKSFEIDLYENINGVENTYVGYISTKFVGADFPVDLKLGENSYNYNNGENVDTVLIKKVGAQTACDHLDDNECTDDCKASKLIKSLNPEDMTSFYSDLEENNYYEMQVTAEKDGREEFCQGFISTYPGGDDLGVFTKGYTFTLDPTSIVSESDYGVATTAIKPSDYDFTSAKKYICYKTEEVDYLNSSRSYIYRWVVPETGEYRIETVGLATAKLHEFTEYDGEIKYSCTYNSRATTQNVSEWIEILAGQSLYFVLELADGSAAPSGFRIRRLDYPNSDGISAYRDEVKADCQNGTYSNDDNNCELEFNGDVNVFGYNLVKGKGYLDFKNVKTDLKVELGYYTEDLNGNDKFWVENNYTVNTTDRKPIDCPFEKEVYYISVCRKSIPDIGSLGYYDEESYTYDFNFYAPNRKDSGEVAAHPTYGDIPAYATEINLNEQYYNGTRTLHKGDADWYTFTTDSQGGKFKATLFDTYEKVLYDIALYSEDEIEFKSTTTWYLGENSGSVDLQSDRKILSFKDLLPNKKYYLVINRPDSNTYSSYHPYELEVNIKKANPTAVLNEDVQLSHIAGKDIDDLAEVKSEIMAKMTCSLYGEEVSNAEAINDVELYLNNNILTAEALNGLEVGQYNVVPKYKGVAATGGTVTLTISRPVAGDKIEIDIIPEDEDTREFEWLHCARVLANFKLAKENLPASTLTEEDVAELMGFDETEFSSANIKQALRAVNYFYSNGTSDEGNFKKVSNFNMMTEEKFYENIADNKIFILQMLDLNDKTNVDKMKYVIICGVDKGNHKLKVYDCLETGNLVRWVDSSLIFNGGYVSNNANIKVNGEIIE